MKKRILASLLKGMSGSELYAFLVATILNMSRSYNISTDDIILALKQIIALTEKENKNVR
ncbi:MAG: hypothetical protein IKW90_07700 [Lachnospiraceae bacterium]|nr:hypothetical protein [Lachnospiraceae bacterium]